MNRARLMIGALGLQRSLTGAALLLRPAQVGAAVARGAAQPSTGVIRLLGGRLLAQGLLYLAGPGCLVMRAGAGVDLLHAGTMLTAAAVRPQYRRVALASAAEAFEAMTVAAAASAGRP